MTDEKKEEKDTTPEALKQNLKKGGKKFLWLTIGIIFLVVLNLCISIATLVLVISRPTPGQFLNNTTQPLQRIRN